MAIDRDRLLAWPFEDVVQTYTERDAVLYGLSIGFGENPVDSRQLQFVYENDLTVFPMFALTLGSPGPWKSDPRSGITASHVVHGEQGITLHRVLPAAGRVRGVNRIVDVIDKGAGKGALVYVERVLYDDETQQPLATLWSTSFCRADGGFGGPSVGGSVYARQAVATPPSRPADCIVELPTLPQSALLYRLNGDMNPLHADPDSARDAGFPRPILHGLCTFAVAARGIHDAFCMDGTTALDSIYARFASPVFPGETLVLELWREGHQVIFEAGVKNRTATVLNRGNATLSCKAGSDTYDRAATSAARDS